MNFNRTLAALLLTTTLAAPSFAQPPDGGPRGDHGKHEFNPNRLPPQLEALNLSDAQKAQVKALGEAKHAEREKDRTAHEALRDSLRNLSPASPSYTQEADRIATQIGQQKAQDVREEAAMRAKVWAMLTPSQQSQLAAMPKPEPRKMGWRKHGN